MRKQILKHLDQLGSTEQTDFRNRFQKCLSQVEVDAIELSFNSNGGNSGRKSVGCLLN